MSLKLKTFFIAVIGSFTLLTPVLVSGVANAASASVSNGFNSTLCDSADKAVSGGGLSFNNPGSSQGCTNDTNSGDTLGRILNTVINVFSVVVGAVSVIMIIIGGFRYITSGGNDQSIAGAKNTIIYALIGLVIVVLAQVIVHFVITKIGSTGP